MTLTMQRLLGFDTETTGVNVGSDRIVSAALVEVNGNDRIIDTWLINPGVEIPQQATDVHGITTADLLARGTDPKVALTEISARITAAIEQGIPIVAFNAGFDLTLLECELSRHGLPTIASRVPAIAPVVDPLVLDRHYDRFRSGSRRLIDMCQFYEVAVMAAELHDAEMDVLATLDLLEAVFLKYSDQLPATYSELHELQVGAYRKWAENFRAYLDRKGSASQPPSCEWPIHEFA